MGLMVADFLSVNGKEVVVLHRGSHYAEEMASNDRYYLCERLKQERVTLYKQVAIKKVLADGVKFNVKGEDIQISGFDTLTIAEKMYPIRQSIQFLKGFEGPVHVIGDAKSPRVLQDAISDGEDIGRLL